MCGWHVTAKYGFWADEPQRPGTYLVVRKHYARGRSLYFRMHDDMARDRDTKRRIIQVFKNQNWKVEACATITRCYRKAPNPFANVYGKTGYDDYARQLQHGNAYTDYVLHNKPKPACTCAYAQGVGTRHLGSCPLFDHRR